MESTRLSSRAGEPLGSVALVPLAGAAAADSGPAFAREVERAAARARGDGLAARRHEALAEERRAQRRAGFEGERTPEEAPRAAPAAAAPPAPVRSAVTAQSVPASAQAPAPAPGAAPSACASCAPAVAAGPSAQDPALAGAVASAPAASVAASAAADHARAALSAAPASEARVAAPAPEAPPPQAKPAAPAARAPDAAAPAEGPEAAPLARVEAILEQIRLHAAPGVRRLTLELEPADLGRLSIQLALRSGRVTAIVRAEDARTLELLERRSDELRTLLDARGVRTDSLTFALGFATPRARRSGTDAGLPTTSDPVRASGPGLDTLA
ncbi:MAG TPA: flagellar hook-length control protein FliK [Planctomycetota bacterium]